MSFGGAPSVQAPPPPPPAPPPPPTEVEPEVRKARAKNRTAAALAGGRASTILTGSQGLSTPSADGAKQLLGV